MHRVLIKGMRCSHCAEHVQERLGQKVTQVQVDLRHATATFTGQATLAELNATLAGTRFQAVTFL